MLEPLKARYPGWLQCPDWYGAGVVLMSRWQAVQGSQGCDAIEKIGWMQVHLTANPGERCERSTRLTVDGFSRGRGWQLEQK